MSRASWTRGWAALAPAAALALALALVPACSDDDAGPVDEGAAPGASSDTDAAELPDGAGDLVGRWAHYDEVAYEDEAMRTIIVSTGFADLEVRDGQLWNVQRFCHADVVSDQDIEVGISDAATQAIVPADTPVEVSDEGGDLRLVRPATPTGIGIELEDPANDPLPTDAADPRIVDADGDGNPGITSTIEVTEDLRGEVYLARREIFVYDLVQEGPDRLVGTITDSSEQLVLGASDPAFLTPAQWRQIDDPERNPVIWERVDDDWDCARLADERDALFPPLPAADW